MDDVDAVVIGAGAAGLLAARELAARGSSVLLVEARDRIGGRMRSVVAPRAGAPVELGPEFVHGRPAITYDLLRACGVAVLDDAEASFVRRAGAFAPSDHDPFAAASDLLAEALAEPLDQSVAALTARAARDPARREAASWTAQLVAGFDAADPERASARAIAAEWVGDASADGAQSRPAGGYAPLVAHLGRTLDPARVRLLTRTVVTRVARDAYGVSVEANGPLGAHAFRARRALVTVPAGVLRAPEGERGAIRFDPPLPDVTRAAIECIVMGPVVKVVLQYRTPFWETLRDGAYRDGAFFSTDGPFPTLWTQLPVRANLLTAWAGGPAAERLAARDEAGAVAAAHACVERAFGDAAAARNAFEAGYVHDWQRDPFSRGAYTYVAVGGEHAREDLARPIDGVLWFAGEATAADGEGGTVAGALASGRRAAREMAP